MDINAAQAEGQSKATAWLAQNLPIEETLVSPLAEKTPPAVPPATPPAQPPVDTKPGIAEAIRRDREARAAAQTASQEASKYKGELEALRTENESLKASGATTDPFEFLKHRKLTKDQQALWGQAFLYDLKPEVAPQEFRLDIYKAEQARQKAAEAEQAQREQAEAAQQQQRAHLDRYADELIAHVQASPGSSPESELWFSEDGPDGQPQVNHRVYAQSLFATADNLARRAQKTGQPADLSPANVARVLEAEVSKRLARRDAKRGSKPAETTKQVPPVVPAQGGKPATETTTSADGLRGGPPLPPDMSDEARKARAIAAAFGGK